MKWLIINADDFGVTKKINNGIINSYVNGVLTSTSIMANGEAFRDAVRLSRKIPDLSIGVHLVLVGEKSVLPPQEVPSIIGPNGRLIENYSLFIHKFFLRQIRRIDIKKEIRAQIEKILAAGIDISHINGHQHLHVLPWILDLVLELAKEYKISWVRNSYDCITSKKQWDQLGLRVIANIAKNKIKKRKLKTSDYFYGAGYSGKLTEKNLLYVLENIPQGISELMCHPGDYDAQLKSRYKRFWGCGWKEEQDALTSARVKNFIERKEIILTSYSELK